MIDIAALATLLANEADDDGDEALSLAMLSSMFCLTTLGVKIFPLSHEEFVEDVTDAVEAAPLLTMDVHCEVDPLPFETHDLEPVLARDVLLWKSGICKVLVALLDLILTLTSFLCSLPSLSR